MTEVRTISKEPILTAVSCAAPADALAALRKICTDVILLPPDPLLPAPAASHADMLLFPIGDTLAVHRLYYSIARPEVDAILSRTGLHLLLTDCPRGAVYPLDVSLNALLCGRFLFGRLDVLAPELLTLAAENGITPVPVKQGYAGCSGLVAGGTIVTADPSLKKGAQACGIPVLTVPDRDILLPGYDHGFFGGCGGVYGNCVVFCGTPDPVAYAPFYEYAAGAGMDVVCLGTGPLYDCGGIRFFRYSK